MKQILILSAMLLCITSFAQSAWQRENSNNEFQMSRSVSGGSPANAWLGSGVLYEFGQSDISDNILVSGRVLLELAKIKGLHLPIMSNVDFSFNTPIKELKVGLYPWHLLSNNFIAHGGVEFQTDGALEKKILKVFAGLEVVFLNDNGLPLTLSLTPTVLLEHSTIYGLDGVIVVPVANGLGLLGQVQAQFNGSPTLFALGVVTNKLL